MAATTPTSPDRPIQVRALLSVAGVLFALALMRVGNDSESHGWPVWLSTTLALVAIPLALVAVAVQVRAAGLGRRRR